MALISMTGFGRGEASDAGVKVEVELSCVNRKQFDARINVPRPLATLEARMVDVIHKTVRRGFVQGLVKAAAAGDGASRRVRVDAGLAEAYVSELRRTAHRLSLPDNLDARALLALPEVVKFEGAPEDPELVWPLARPALARALKELRGMQAAEGAALEKDIRGRLAKLDARLERIRAQAPRVVVRYRKALKARLAQVGVLMHADPQNLWKEVVLFADRCDISEEITRLRSHFDQAKRIIESRDAAGRTLDFLCQEMFREINTIGSKANDAAIATHVVFFKTELECIREQVQNVE